MDKFRTKNTYDIENFNLNREMDIYKNSKKNIQILDDRDLFNKFSNGNEQIDITNSINTENNFGMPVFNGQILNNKKSLLSSPYIIEDNKKNNFISNNFSINGNDLFAELEQDNDLDKLQKEDLNNMAYNNSNTDMSKNRICKIEKDIAEYEFDSIKEKDFFVLDVNSPFALGYLWKSLVLLSKNPSTEKLLKLLGIKNKELIVNDMKNHSDVINEYGELQFIFPLSNQVLNTNFIKKIEDVYNIKLITIDEKLDNTVKINFKYNFQLEIPFYYQPKIINDFLLGYDKNKIKFLELTDVPCYLFQDNNMVLLEIPVGSSMILGFIYKTNRENVDILPYEFLLSEKKPDNIIKKLIIPKINRNKKSVYSKKFKEELSNVHLGEIIYGNLFNLEVNLEIGLEITTTQDISKNKYDIKKTIDFININHKCYYYIKNLNINNKILSNGMINY